MSLLTSLDRLYGESKRNKWFGYFAVCCRLALALGFIPSGFVKVSGERFTALPSNHPLGHYFEALYLTGYYYTFIGLGQWLASLLLIIPRTALLGAVIYFPIILNITVLAYATRFEGTRITTLMLLANLFLLVWDFDRLQHILPSRRPDKDRYVVDKTSKFPIRFAVGVFLACALVIVVNAFIFEMRPGNSRIECTNGCRDNRYPDACQHFCSCIFDRGDLLNTCLKDFEKEKEAVANP